VLRENKRDGKNIPTEVSVCDRRLQEGHPNSRTVIDATRASIRRSRSFALSKSEVALSKREVVGVRRVQMLQHRMFRACAMFEVNLVSMPARASCQHCLGETLMSWKTPKIVEVPVGMEINMYACAARK
jgi:coenzyme PQQ precursor peptide PqqA